VHQKQWIVCGKLSARSARMTRRKTKWNFSTEANMKVFELSNAVVEDGFAERAEVVLKKTSYTTAP
jgi:hypothetical protein